MKNGTEVCILNKALVLSFSHPPKVKKIQISTGQTSSKEIFSKSCFPLPWGIAMGTKAHTGVDNKKV